MKTGQPELRAVIVGEGYERAALEALRDELGAADWISLPGRVGDEELVDWYRRAWVVASSSQREGWGMTLTEAASCGTPAVATAIAGHADAVLDGESGVLVDDPATSRPRSGGSWATTSCAAASPRARWPGRAGSPGTPPPAAPSRRWRRRRHRVLDSPGLAAGQPSMPMIVGGGGGVGTISPGGTARSFRRRSGLRTRKPRPEITASASRRTTPSQIRLPALTNDASQLEPAR